MSHRVTRPAVIGSAVLLAFCLQQTTASEGANPIPATGAAPLAAGQQGKDVPEYSADGRLVFPGAYREWVFLSSGLDMSYRERMVGHSMFDNVFVEPRAYRAFLDTGTWPDRTVLVMEVRGAASKGSINASGHFQTGELMGFEAHVKDTKRFPGGWAFFAFAGKEPASALPTAAECYACHRQNAAVDTTFVQFYPTLLPIAQLRGTVKPGTDLK
jgi:hypothetical protein